MYFHQTELFTDFSQKTNIMQTGVCCRGTVKYWLGLPYIYARICYYASKNKIRIIDTQKLCEETVHLIKCILFNQNHLFKTMTFRIIRQHE